MTQNDQSEDEGEALLLLPCPEPCADIQMISDKMDRGGKL